MTRTNYETGAQLERDVVDYLVKHGYWATRTPGSKGKRKVDVVAIKPLQTLFIQCKYGTGTAGPVERALLVNLARMVHAEPLLATRRPRRHIVFRRLRGAGSGEWEPWTPDTLGVA